MTQHVHIIESPSATDFYANVREGALLVEALKLLGIQSKYRIATDLERFKSALEEVECNSPSLGPPILHLSMHGDANGLELSDKSRITWDFLKSLLIPVNAQLNGKLILCMSSCRGIHGIQMVVGMPKDERPFAIILGSTFPMLLSDLALGFLTFYNHYLFKNSGLDNALRAMQVAAGNAYFMKIAADEVTADLLAS